MRLYLTLFSLVLTPLFWQVSLSQTLGTVQMDFVGPVEYIVTDSLGRRAGYDPRTATDFQEIPYAYYDRTAGTGSLDPNVSPIEAKEFGFRSPLENSSFSTTYSVQFFGTGSGMFKGDIGMAQTISGKGADFHIVGVIDSNQTVSYVFRYTTDSTVVPTTTKLVDKSSLRQDLDNCFKLNLLGDDKLYKDLSHRLDKFDKYLSEKDSVKARRELEKFGEKVEGVYKETVGRGEEKEKDKGRLIEFEKEHEKFVTQDAYQILNEDVGLLLQQLPEKHERDHEGEDRGKR